MTQQELITNLVGNSNLDLEVVIKDTAECKVIAKFIALSFERNSYVTMKLEVTTINKDVSLNTQGTVTDMDPIVITKMIRADENSQIPVVDENGDPFLDDEGVQLTIPENIFWKYLAWEQPLYAGFKTLLENVIKVKFNMVPNNLVLQVNSQSINNPN